VGGITVTGGKLFTSALLASAFLALAVWAQPNREEKKTLPWDLARAKTDAARRTCQALAQEYLEGKATVEQVHQWSQRWLNAQRELSSKKSDQLAAFQDHVSRMEQLEQAAKTRFDSRRGPLSDLSAAEYHRIDAQLALSRAKSSR
jgi:hypothetical protein